MAAMLTGSRSGFCTIKRVNAAPASLVGAVRPFTTRRPAHGARIPTRVAAQAQQVQGDDEEEDFHRILAGMLLEEDQTMVGDDGEEEELDEDELEAVAAVALMSDTTNAEAMVEAFMAKELAEGDVATEAQLRRRGELLFAEAATGHGGSAEQRDAIMESAAIQMLKLVPAAQDVEDVQISPNGFSAYDEDEEAGMSQEQKEAISQFKLSKAELKALLPATWDTVNVDFFTTKKDLAIALPAFKLNVLWMEKNIAVAVDQVYSRGQTSPLTEYFFWPRKDAWDELRISLETRPWIAERDRVALLNRLTQIINFWQDDQTGHTVAEARATFTDCSFSGA